MAANRVMFVFSIASMLMWVLPIAVLQVFNYNLIPGLESMSSKSRTLWSGGMAVVSVNVIIAVYIFLALKESPPVAVTPQPDPVFARRAKESLAKMGASPGRAAPPPPTQPSTTAEADTGVKEE